MDMKNTAILLMLLLCILGLIVGVYYTDASEADLNTDDYNDIIIDDAEETITIDLLNHNPNSLNQKMQDLLFNLN
ncbi:hypothetical protein [Methanobrevibacter sp.]|uniref:hypothetical protein n=1 Tax=Methanobrevibacter sp. TaxID=66852 RepID=UPI0026E04132|nr:hypothetical protein [Methanobrevibacter sp.]MDO5860219.1 hypothetical protein [Methanobrevibacter sp.]